jgi:D-alanyl-D-alanine carboxypeptidase (penicillin-binding protein 5/6)
VGRITRSDSKRKQKIYRLTALVVGLCMLLMVWPASAEEEWDVTARSFAIMDAETGRILLEYNSRKMYPPASTIKVMTAMYVLDHLKMDDKVRVSKYAASAPASKINIKEGEVYTVKELLYALLLSSANDGARALAERTAGSEATFAHRVTQMMRRWGAYRTKVATANGLPKPDQYSTAEDLAIIFRRAMQDPEFAKIMGTKYYHIQGERELRNHDRFLFTTPLAQGGKTGYTRAAKHTYVGMFRNQDKAIIVSLMGSKKKWADLRTLIEKGFALSGAPIAKLEPKEERLRFARRHMGNSVKVTKKRSKRKRSSHKRKRSSHKKRAKIRRVSKKSQVSVSSLAGVPDKKSRKK